MTEISYRHFPTIADFPELERRQRIDIGLRPIMLIVLVGITVALFLLVLTLGSVDIPLEQIITVLAGGEAERRSWTNIVMKFRLPKAVTAVLAGAALGVSGLLMQTFFRNPLAGPFVLGISSGASLGVALIVLSAGTVGGSLIGGLGLQGDLQIAVAAALGSGSTMLIVLLVAMRVQSRTSLLVLGLMLGYFVSAMVSLLMYFSAPERIQAYIDWTFGSFNGITWSQIRIMGAAIACGVVIAALLTKYLNALLLGEIYARSMGVNLALTRLSIVFATGLLAGTVTAFCGPIGFIGIAVPHLCRMIFNTSDHRMLIPGCILMGAIIALISAFIAEMPGSTMLLPLNAVTSLIGAPILIFVILRQQNLQQSFGN